MPYDESLAVRIRNLVSARRDVEEKRMFGGLAYMVRGHMTCGIVRDELMVRVGPATYEEALAEPHVREMDFTGKPIRGMIYVKPEGFDTRAKLERWLARALAYTEALPAKTKPATKKKPRR